MARCFRHRQSAPAQRPILTFPPVSALLDEDARLCSLSVFDAFRLLQELVTVPRTSVKRCSSAACSPMTWSPVLKIRRR
jgi:hypothetical protein